jgi:hypothetical protein
VEAITQRDTDSRRALALASTVTKHEEELAARACQVNQWEQEVEKLEKSSSCHRHMTGGFAHLEEVFIKVLPFF